MKVVGKFVLVSVTQEPRYNEPDKVNNIILFADGGDTLKFYVNDALYNGLKDKPLYKPYQVEMNYKPYSQKVAYCMDLLSVTETKSA